MSIFASIKMCRLPDRLMTRSSPNIGVGVPGRQQGIDDLRAKSTEETATRRAPATRQVSPVVHGVSDLRLHRTGLLAAGCCSFAVVNVLALTLVKVPWVASRVLRVSGPERGFAAEKESSGRRGRRGEDE